MATASFAIKHITSIPRESAGEDSLHDASFFIQKRAVGKSSIETKKSENPLRKKPHRLKSSVYRADNSCKVREPEAASVKKSIASLYYNYRPSSGDPSGGRATKYGVTWDLSASCRLCKNPESKNFIFPFRLRHHCRFCGRAVCKSCSRHKMMIYGAKKRACDKCYTKRQEESGKSSFKDGKLAYTEKKSESKRPMLKIFLSCQFNSAITSCIKVMLKNGTNLDATPIGTTKPVENSMQPRFKEPVLCEYIFEAEQTVHFVISERIAGKDRDFGTASIVLTHMLTNNERKQLEVPIDGPEGCTLTVTSERIGKGVDDEIDFQFGAKGLPKFDGPFGKADPFYQIERKISCEKRVVSKSKIEPKTLNPQWEPDSILKKWLCDDDNGDEELTINVYDDDGKGKVNFIGRVERANGGPINVKSLLEDNNNETLQSVGKFVITPHPFCDQPKHQRASYQNNGTFLINKFKQKTRHNFLQYMCGGLELKLSMAIDFTESNHPPNQADSLHCMIKEDPTPYEKVIKSMGSILQHYDKDGMIPVYGFGAQLRQNVRQEFGPTQHCFPLDPQNVELNGVQGVLEAYRRLLEGEGGGGGGGGSPHESRQYHKICFDGPTFFSDCISRLATEVEESTANDPAPQPDGDDGWVTQEHQEYHVLIILTDGIVSDLECTIQQIVRCSHLPISIIIVGVGKANFMKMEMLDGDDEMLTDKFGNKAERDIVQFVPFAALNHDPDLLARVTLGELPGQVTEYFGRKKIRPNPDVDIAAERESSTAAAAAAAATPPLPPTGSIVAAAAATTANSLSVVIEPEREPVTAAGRALTPVTADGRALTAAAVAAATDNSGSVAVEPVAPALPASNAGNVSADKLDLF